MFLLLPFFPFFPLHSSSPVLFFLHVSASLLPFSLSVNEQLCLFWQKKLEPTMRCASMSSVYACTQLKKHREGNRDLWSHPPVFLRDAPVVLLPPLVVITGGIGLFPHGSHKQRTHCLVSVFSHSPSALMLCVVVALFAS